MASIQPMTRNEILDQMPDWDWDVLADVRSMKNITREEYIDTMEYLYGSDIELLTEDIANGLVGKGIVYCMWASGIWNEKPFAECKQISDPDDLIAFELAAPAKSGFVLRDPNTMAHIVLSKYKNVHMSNSKIYVDNVDGFLYPVFVFVKRS